MALLDDVLNDMREKEHDGLRRVIEDDPCTMEFNDLDSVPREELITRDSEGRFLYPECGNRVRNLVIPFKSVGQMTVKLQCMNELYGTVGNDHPVCYDVVQDTWHKCPARYPLCYTKADMRAYAAEMLDDSSLNTLGYDDMGVVTPMGEHVIKALALQQVSADELTKSLRAIGVKVNGKITKLYTGGWRLDDDWLDLYQLLASNDLIQ